MVERAGAGWIGPGGGGQGGGGPGGGMQGGGAGRAEGVQGRPDSGQPWRLGGTVVLIHKIVRRIRVECRFGAEY